MALHKPTRRCAFLLLLMLGIAASRADAQTTRAPSVRYQLRARVDDNAGRVSGTATVSFQHFSTDTVRSISLQLGYNAYRPGARGWPAKAGAQDGTAGWQRISNITVDGQPVAIEWPNAPDSSLARLMLARPLTRASSIAVEYAWEGQAPALPWRMQHAGRRMELVGWYPLLIDEVSRTPVLSPAMSDQLLELDIAADQIMGGTGEVTCGDPGWARAGVLARRTVLPGDSACVHADAARRTVVWKADGVTELAYALSPTFRYEEGDIFDRPVRTLYEQGQTTSWGAGLAARRAETALAWAIEIGGLYPWPHMTVIESLDRMSQALPMVLMSTDAHQSSLLHLVGLMISQQMLVGGSRVVTLGSAAFQTTWFFEKLGRTGDYARLEREILDWDLDGLARQDEPLAKNTSSAPCATTYCRRTEFLQHQLRWWANDDDVVRDIYRTVIERFLLKPTTPGAFMLTSRELVRPDPSPLYAQVPTGNTLFDDAVRHAARTRLPDGRWQTQVVIERRAAGRFPQTVWVIAESDTAAERAIRLSAQETLSIATASRPLRVVVDPLAESHDWNMLNNTRSFARRVPLLTGRSERYFGGNFGRRYKRDHVTQGFSPTVWYNDAGGWTYGLRARQNYLDRYELNDWWIGISTEPGKRDVHGLLRLRNPVWLRATRWSQMLEVARLEGRTTAAAALSYQLPRAVRSRSATEFGISARWLDVTDTAYLDPRLYTDASTGEVTAQFRQSSESDMQQAVLQLAATGGHSDGSYTRLMLDASTRRTLPGSFSVGLRVHGARVAGRAPLQRRIFLAGSDPYEQLRSPFMRSRGALFNRSGFHYQDGGGGGVRLAPPHLNGRDVAGLTLEVDRTLLSTPVQLLRRVSVGVFADGARSEGASFGDAGIGLRIDQRIGRTSFQSRIDVGAWTSRDSWRGWVFSLTPSF